MERLKATIRAVCTLALTESQSFAYLETTHSEACGVSRVVHSPVPSAERVVFDDVVTHTVRVVTRRLAVACTKDSVSCCGSPVGFFQKPALSPMFLRGYPDQVFYTSHDGYSLDQK